MIYQYSSGPILYCVDGKSSVHQDLIQGVEMVPDLDVDTGEDIQGSINKKDAKDGERQTDFIFLKLECGNNVKICCHRENDMCANIDFILE